MVEQNPTKTHLSSGYLLKNGWKKKNERIDGNWISTYEKGTGTVKYDGLTWTYTSFPESFYFTPEDGLKITPRKVQFIECLK